jgi:hypothetical protein
MLAHAVTIACVSALTLTASARPSCARSVTECTKDHVCHYASRADVLLGFPVRFPADPHPSLMLPISCPVVVEFAMS